MKHVENLVHGTILEFIGVEGKSTRRLRVCKIPIVLGGASYDRILPPHSYISVRDFKSPRYLADYLKLLDSNDTLYMEYFNWRRDYQTIYPLSRFHDICGVCDILHTSNYSYKTNFKLNDYWKAEDQCVLGKDARSFLGIKGRGGKTKVS